MGDLRSVGPVIVTGASQGIGEGIAARLVRDGFHVALVARRREALDAVAARIPAVDGVSVRVYPCDVADAAAVDAMVDQVRSDFDGIAGLVNNAGVTRDALLVRMTPAQWREVMAINLDGAYHCLRAVAPLMMRARTGRVINITSVVGQTGNPGQVNYSASKAGLIGMTLSAARELAGRGVNVNAIAPGFIETAMTAEMPASAVEQMTAQIPLKRLGAVEDVAGMVSFLMSDDASYVTGQVLNCDGGMVMG